MFPPSLYFPRCSMQCDRARRSPLTTRGSDVTSTRLSYDFVAGAGIWSDTTGATRTFRVDRLDGWPEVDEPGSSTLPDGFDMDAEPAGPWQFGDGAPISVDVLVDRVEAARVLDELGDGSLSERRGDGSVVVRLSVTNVPALRSWVLALGARAEVLEPPEVRGAMISWLEDMAAMTPVGNPDAVSPNADHSPNVARSGGTRSDATHAGGNVIKAGE